MKGFLKILGSQIKERRKLLGLTQKQLAELLGKDASIITKYEAGTVDLPVSVVNKLAEILQTSVAYLAGETNDPTPPRKEKEAIPAKPEKPVKLVPVFSTTVSAGNGIFPDSFHPETYMPVERYDVDYVFIVQGKSMEPYVLDGSKILVKAIPNPRDGEMILCIYDGMFYVKYFHKEGDKIYLISEDSTYPPIPIEPNKQFEIIGVVVEIRNPSVRKRFRKR